MAGLSKWLETELGGVHTYEEFQRRSGLHADNDPDHAVHYRLLASIAAQFVAKYDGRPLPVAVADRSLREFKEVVRKVEQAMQDNAEVQLRVLNEIAKVELG